MPETLAAAKAMLAVRKSVRAGLGGFTAAGIALCLIWALLLAGGRAFTLPFVVLVCALAGMAGAVGGMLKVVLAPAGKIAAYVDWRIKGGGTVMAAVERGGGFVAPARKKLLAAPASALVSPFLPRWSSLSLLPVALALLLAGGSSGTARPLGFLVQSATDGKGGGQDTTQAGKEAEFPEKLVLFRTRPSQSTESPATRLDHLLNGTGEKTASIPLPAGRGEEGTSGDRPSSESTGSGAAEPDEETGHSPRAGKTSTVQNHLGSLGPEWIRVSRRYLEQLREDK